MKLQKVDKQRGKINIKNGKPTVFIHRIHFLNFRLFLNHFQCGRALHNIRPTEFGSKPYPSVSPTSNDPHFSSTKQESWKHQYNMRSNHRRRSRAITSVSGRLSAPDARRPTSLLLTDVPTRTQQRSDTFESEIESRRVSSSPSLSSSFSDDQQSKPH